ncbi:peptidyl-prolyl cis-trans isomerase [Streptomyces muensis]|uniref:Peptidyl-prolyl cis-trans isomerase n=1 Tax=Streptomyces muensis TaxID=1077944 RepID=A0A9X1TPU7_STRM4|nr:peptidyl-prolyl cis-trans isomerase [Streptomyces muensis]MCF1598164.1 peptidyl-prolyl cis-trans isomerase [Streptomyces muensis]
MREHAASVHGHPIPKARVDAFLEAVPARDPETRPESLARAERQRRRWATQVLVIDELAQQACKARGLATLLRGAGLYRLAAPPRGATSHNGAAPAEQPLTTPPAERTVADLGSIIAVALAHSPAARTLLTHLESEQHIPETAIRDYYDRNRDRYLTPSALSRGVDPYDPATTPADFLPYERTRPGIERELREAAARWAFFAWLDQARTGVEYAPGHEHPGDPSHPDHEHRH